MREVARRATVLAVAERDGHSPVQLDVRRGKHETRSDGVRTVPSVRRNRTGCSHSQGAVLAGRGVHSQRRSPNRPTDQHLRLARSVLFDPVMSLPFRGWIYMIVPIIGLGLAADARADKKVDWTPYLEQPGDRLKPAPKAKEAIATPTKAKAQPRVAKQRPNAQAQQAKPKAKRKTR